MSNNVTDYAIAAWQLYQAGKAVKEHYQRYKMARRVRRRAVGPTSKSGMWINVAGELLANPGSTQMEELLSPGDWSGTVTERNATLLRVVIQMYTMTFNGEGYPQASNYALVHGKYVSLSGMDIDNFAEWPDFFAEWDDVLRIGRIEYSGEDVTGQVNLPVQYSQLPDPVVNFRTARRLRPDSSVILAIGGVNRILVAETYMVRYYARFFVKPR